MEENFEEDDKYAAEMIIKEQRQKQRKKFNSSEVKLEVSTSHKRLLATTIRNTSSYNQAVLRGDILPQQKREVEVKKKKKSTKKLAERFASSIDDRDLAPPTAESFKKLGALVSHSKLKSKRKKSNIDLEDFLGQHVDQGVFGPIPGRASVPNSSGQPNSSLPEKCPW